VRKLIQYVGEPVITFPGGLHFGFSLGPNIAEAVNFASAHWLPLAFRSHLDYAAARMTPKVDIPHVCVFSRQPSVFSQQPPVFSKNFLSQMAYNLACAADGVSRFTATDDLEALFINLAQATQRDLHDVCFYTKILCFF